MIIKEIIDVLEKIAPPFLQENYDNSGLISGSINWQCTGIITTLDVTEAVVAEAIEKKCNLIVSHHPIIFSGLKKITSKNYVEKIIITAIKNDIALYAIHTNLDNVLIGVNTTLANKLGLINTKVLQPKNNYLKKLYCFVPLNFAEKVRTALFDAGGGNISNYSECSFNTKGFGTFKAAENTHPFVGKIGQQHTEEEIKIEIIFPAWLQQKIYTALLSAHPYEEIAYDIVALDNSSAQIGSGLIGQLPQPLSPLNLLKKIKDIFNLSVIKHSPLNQNMVKNIALCGGAGSFLINDAIQTGADFYISSDIKYHEFFEANNKIVIADIGHYESEQFTIQLLFDILSKKFPTFAVLKTGVITNPVHYFL